MLKYSVVACVLLMQVADAASLDQLRVISSRPLQAHIKVSDINQSTKISIASRDAYLKSNLTPPVELPNISLSVVSSQGSTAILEFRTANPIDTDPLNLLLEIHENGLSRLQNFVVSSNNKDVPPKTESQARRRVKIGDTLSAISQDYITSKVSIEQAMLGIYQSNPQAFNGNMNVLIAFRILDIPNEDSLSEIEGAEEFVNSQVNNWRIYKRQLAARGIIPRQNQPPPPAIIAESVEENNADKLKINPIQELDSDEEKNIIQMETLKSTQADIAELSENLETISKALEEQESLISQNIEKEDTTETSHMGDIPEIPEEKLQDQQEDDNLFYLSVGLILFSMALIIALIIYSLKFNRRKGKLPVAELIPDDIRKGGKKIDLPGYDTLGKSEAMKYVDEDLAKKSQEFENKRAKLEQILEDQGIILPQDQEASISEISRTDTPENEGINENVENESIEIAKAETPENIFDEPPNQTETVVSAAPENDSRAKAVTEDLGIPEPEKTEEDQPQKPEPENPILDFNFDVEVSDQGNNTQADQTSEIEVPVDSKENLSESEMLDLAKVYADMNDSEGAREILQELIKNTSSETMRSQAEELMKVI